jgi:hypothetical protein
MVYKKWLIFCISQMVYFGIAGIKNRLPTAPKMYFVVVYAMKIEMVKSRIEKLTWC